MAITSRLSENTKLDHYLSGFAPMQRAKVRNALERMMRLNGRYMFRWEVAEELASNPLLTIDRDKGRVYTSESTFLDISSLTSTLVAYVEHLTDR